MNIACICDDRFPSEAANTQQVVKTAAAVARQGHSIDLVLPRMWQSFGLDLTERKRLLEEYYAVSGPFGLKQIISWIPTRMRFHKLSHGVVGPLNTWLGSYDVLYTRNFLPVLLGLLTGQRVVFETYRLLGQQYPILGDPMRRVSRHPDFLGVVTHSELALEGMLEIGIESEKVEVIHNGYDPEDLEPRLGRIQARGLLNRKLGWDLEPDANVVCYTGRIDPDKGMDILLDIAKLTPETTYVLVGATLYRDGGWLERKAREAGVTNVRRAGRVDPKALAPFMYAADGLIIPPTSGPLEKKGNTVLPIKTFGYLGAGRPVIAPRLRDTVEVLTHEGNALLTEPDSAEDAARAIRRLATDRALWEAMARRAHEDGLAFTWEARARKFVSFLERRLADLNRTRG